MTRATIFTLFFSILLILMLPMSAASQAGGLGDQFFHQNSPGIEDFAEEQDRFGSAVATGDFNGDGYLDVAIGAYWDSVDGASKAGLVHVFYGNTQGRLSASDSEVWTQNSAGVADAAEVDDLFGYSLAVGDFDNSGHDDLAVGVPGESVGFAYGAGGVHVFYGADGGLGAGTNLLFTQDTLAMSDSSEWVDQFGFSLAVGNFDGDLFDDLAIGVSQESAESGTTIFATGAVHVVYGSGFGGLNPILHEEYWTQATTGVPGTDGESDQFGDALAAGDFDNDGYDDLAVGASGDDDGGAFRAGAVTILTGSIAGLGTLGPILFQNDVSDDPVESSDQFGSALATGYFNNDPYEDLVITASEWDLDGYQEAGIVHVVYGSSAGLQTGPGTPNQTVTRDVLENFDEFGRASASGDINGDGYDDLALGATGAEVNGQNGAGLVHVLLGGEDGLDLVNRQLLNQNLSGSEDPAEPSDLFGDALAIGHLNGDQCADIVVGVRGESIVPGQTNNGAVQVFYSGLFGDDFESGTTSAWSFVTP